MHPPAAFGLPPCRSSRSESAPRGLPSLRAVLVLSVPGRMGDALGGDGVAGKRLAGEQGRDLRAVRVVVLVHHAGDVVQGDAADAFLVTGASPSRLWDG